ncbi:hypothetical protein ACFQ9Q_19620 [Streptomyces virginiae]|uniref:hypothetical protein n=1 Tax=Streptomyces virginiae TaxID=1961 RepID=UPI0036B85B59
MGVATPYDRWSQRIVKRIEGSVNDRPAAFVLLNSGRGMDAVSVHQDGPLSLLYRDPYTRLTEKIGLVLEIRPHKIGEALEETPAARRLGKIVAYPEPSGLPGTVRALNARDAVLTDDLARVDAFAARELCLRTGPQWREAVSTALLGDWAAPLDRIGRLHPSSLAQLAAEARVIHRQLTPLWRRKAGHGRVLMLDTPLGNGATLYDLVGGRPDPKDLILGTEDARLGAVLRALAPEERKVALTWAHWQVTTWTEAAALIGATDPVAFGERVRRKLKRLGIEHTRRRGICPAPPNGSGS